VSLEGLARGERLRGGYDETVYWLGNALEYALPLHVLRGRPGIVVAYNVRLTSLYALAAANRPDLEPRRFADVLRSMYGDQAQGALGGTVPLDDVEADRYGVYMAREAIAASKKFFVHLPAALPIARLDASAGDKAKVDQLPLPLPRPMSSAGQSSSKPIAIFAGTGGSREADRVVTQLRALAVEFTIVGEIHPDAASAAIAVPGAQNASGFATFLAKCLAEGLPTLFFGLSFGDHEGAESVVELDGQATDAQLRAVIQGLDREARPISPAKASASVEAVAERFVSLVNDLED